MSTTRNAAIPVVYIGGASRSGSTLLEQVLAAAARLTPAGELRSVWRRGFIENHLCGCGSEFRLCPFWQGVFGDVFDRSDDLDPEAILRLGARVDRSRHIPRLAVPALRGERFEADLERYIAILRRLYATIGARSGGAGIVDSSKEASYGLLLSLIPGLRVHLVHLVRDSRGVAYSRLRWKVNPQVHWKRQYMRRYSPQSTAVEWTRRNVLTEVVGRHAETYVRIRYEDFTRDPDEVVQDILQRLSLDGGIDAEEPGRLVRGHTVSGNPHRFDCRRPIEPDMEWRSNMRRSSQELVRALTLPLLLRYGYVGRGHSRTRSDVH